MTDLVVTFDGIDYILLKELCAMTGLKPYDVTMSDLAQGQIIERPPEGRQRKPRQYITVRAWLALYERVFRLWLAERSTDSEHDDLVDYDDDGVETRKSWHWYGIDKIAEMFDLEPWMIVDRLIVKGNFITGSFHYHGLPLTVQEMWATDEAKATGWIHNYMREPRPCGKWHIHIVLDLEHPEFVELLAKLKGWSLRATKYAIQAALQVEADFRDKKWRGGFRARFAEAAVA